MVRLHACGLIRTERKFMTTKASSTNWRNWSMSTRLFVGAGALAAVLVVAYLYRP
jgi:predicted membrane protein